MSIHVIPMQSDGSPLGMEPCRYIADETIITGHDHAEAVRNYFMTADGHFTAGVWESTPCKDRCDYDVDEACFLLSGVVHVVADDGAEWTFRAGDCFVIPAGFKGTWETVETMRKFHFIHDPKPDQAGAA